MAHTVLLSVYMSTEALKKKEDLNRNIATVELAGEAMK